MKKCLHKNIKRVKQRRSGKSGVYYCNVNECQDCLKVVNKSNMSVLKVVQKDLLNN